MKAWGWLLVGIALGLVGFLVWWQRRAILDAYGNKKEIAAGAKVAGGIQDSASGLASLWSSVKEKF